MHEILKNRKIPALIAAFCLMFLLAMTSGAYAANDGLVGANIKDGVLKGYYGNGGDIVIPDTVTMIDMEAFLDNDNVTSVTIPGSVSCIAANAFKGCTELEKVVFSDPVDGADMIIRLGAFEDCPKLADIEIPATAKYVTGNPFRGCTSLQKIKVHPQNPYYFTDDEGVMFGPWVYEGEPQYEDSNYSLNAYPCGRTAESYTIPSVVNGHNINRVWSSSFRSAKNLKSVEIPASLEILGAYAFEETGLTELYIPDTVTKINSGLFENCTDLKSVRLPSGVTEIPYGFFAGCKSLNNVEFGENITTLAIYAFKDCASLTNLVLPNKLSTIKLAAFEGCTNLQRVVIPAGVINFPSDEYVGTYDPFADAPRTLIVYVEKGSIGEKWAYNNVEGWGYSYEIVNDTDNLSGVDFGKFYLIDADKRVKIEGNFDIKNYLQLERIYSGAEYDKFAQTADGSALAVYRVSVGPAASQLPDTMKISLGLPDGFTKTSKLYHLTNNTVNAVNASVVSRAFTTDVTELGYFGVVDNQTSGGDETEVTTVTVNRSAVELAVGKKVQLSATVLPTNAANKTITWSSDNDGIASVDKNGIVTAVANGTAIITAEAVNGVKGTCKVTVTGGADPVDPTDDAIETAVALNTAAKAGADGEAAFDFALTNAKRIATVQVTFQTDTAAVSFAGKNDFALIGDIKGEMKNGVYTGTAVLAYLTDEHGLFECTAKTVIANLFVNGERPTVKITDVKVAGWDSTGTVKFGTVKGIDPSEATWTGYNKYDLNQDGAVDMLDITFAQKYYHAQTGDSNWNTASACDFNGDGVVDVQDFVEIWLNFTE